MTPLRIGADETVLGARVLRVGTAAVAALFRTERPTPVEIERAIDVIEDALAGLAPVPGATLVVQGDAEAATREAVEARFQRLASAALGDPSGWHDLPPGREALARLVILRELMHHGGFERLVPAADAPQAAR